VCSSDLELMSEEDDVPEIRVELQSAGLVMGYEDDLRRAILNILSNAVKYSFKRGVRRKFISVRGEGWGESGIIVKVRNFGVPLLSADRRTSGSGSRRGKFALLNEIPGMGIGVSEIEKIAKAHDGEFTLDSKPPAEVKSEEQFLRLYAEDPGMAMKVPWVTTATLRIAGASIGG
jgi:signal transduction histidine kinase